MNELVEISGENSEDGPRWEKMKYTDLNGNFEACFRGFGVFFRQPCWQDSNAALGGEDLTKLTLQQLTRR